MRALPSTPYCFAENYVEARDRFRAVCAEIGVEVEQKINPHGLGPAGEQLSSDVAFFGRRDACRVLFVVVGTHGVESFAGSATFLHWLYQGGIGNLPADTSVLVVHGNNPYGWAHQSRTNENNVDINRNWRDHEHPPEDNPWLDDYAQLVSFGEFSELHLRVKLKEFQAFLDGPDRLVKINSLIGGHYGGQARFPDLNNYRGAELEWSVTNMIGVMDDYLDRAKKVVCIDWHTGIGAFGEPFYLPYIVDGTDQKSRFLAWWGEDGIANARAQGNELLGDGLVRTGVYNHLTAKGVDAMTAVIEWGTYGPASIAESLWIDYWLRFVCEDPGSNLATVYRYKFMERFYPSAVEWREAVLKKSLDIYNRTLAGLATWE